MRSACADAVGGLRARPG